MSHETLQIVWFLLIGVLFAGYAVLGGFDLGIGFWRLFTRDEADRKALLRAAGPFWDGNEVWLLTAGGALFAAFPVAYATVFSGLYLALMLVLFALILRAVSIEFREQIPSPRWRNAWDMAFALGSAVPALLFGVAVGNTMRGLKLDAEMNCVGGFFALLNPFSLMIGLLGLAMLATHGAAYLQMRTDGALAARAKSWTAKAWAAYLTLFVAAVLVTLLREPRLLANYRVAPILWALPTLALVAILGIGHHSRLRQPRAAFVVSSLSILALVAMWGAALFPNLVPAINHPAWSVTIHNASSSALTLKTMLIVAGVGMPIVIAYTIWIYRMLGGKVREEGY